MRDWFRRFLRWASSRALASNPLGAPAIDGRSSDLLNTASMPAQDDVVDPFVTDAAVERPEQDRFRRWPFAQRVAQTIAQRRDPASLVVGIYGDWGEGKTSVLNFIPTIFRRLRRAVELELSPFGGRGTAFDSSGEFFMRCCGEPAGIARSSSVWKTLSAPHAAFASSARSNWTGERYPRAECRRWGLYHPSMKSNTFIFASA